MLTLTLRAVRSGSSGALAATIGEEAPEVAMLLPTADADPIERAARAIEDELHRSLPGFSLTVGFSRHAPGPAEIYRAGKEALMAANVAESEGRSPLAFEETGSYRLLLPAMSEDPAELERFFDETVAPLSAYDDQYETELVATVEAYLDNDGNVTPTAETLFTHRHTVRYRLERVRELCGHDLSSTEGREKLGLGLKAMRVLGIPTPGGPAKEARSQGREEVAARNRIEIPGGGFEPPLSGPKPDVLPTTPLRIALASLEPVRRGVGDSFAPTEHVDHSRAGRGRLSLAAAIRWAE